MFALSMGFFSGLRSDHGNGVPRANRPRLQHPRIDPTRPRVVFLVDAAVSS
jgi:hypothetical protein